MTRVDFDGHMLRLIGLRFAPADMDTHWEGLRDVPSSVLELAVARACRTRSEFPSPAELREDCDAVAHQVRTTVIDEDRGTDLPEPVTLGTLPTGKAITAERVWRYYHEACSDSGMESLWCGEPGPSRKPWQELQACERTKPHDPHEWVRRCTCYDSNPHLIRKRERERQFSDAKAKK
jgi:hypothetical protein